MNVINRVLSISLSGLIAGGVLIAYENWNDRDLSRSSSLSAPANAALAALPARPHMGFSEEEQENISVYKAVGPSVVSINTTAMMNQGFFDMVPRQGAGSGVVIDTKGHILTNWHVVAGAQDMKVSFGDEKSSYPAKLVGKDPANDIAVIQVEAPAATLTAATLGDSDNLQIGQRAIAIGNPFGRFGRTMTTGIISSLNRQLRVDGNRLFKNLIQTDASINPGNSGGPLLNSSGEIIGINTAIASMSGGSVGVGFAIPINVAKKLIPELISYGHIDHAWMGISGISIVDLDPQVLKLVNLPVKEGIIVAQVTPDSPAAKAGLQGGNTQVTVGQNILILGGDVIQTVDGRKMNSMDDLANYISNSKKPGQTLSLSILRDGKPLNITVKLSDRPDSQ